MIKVSIEGEQAVKKTIEKAIKKFPEETKKGIELSCIKVEKRAKQYSPVDTGRLRSSITYKVNNYEGSVGTNIEYAPYVEFGTRIMKQQPYLIPALQDSKSEILKIFEDIIKGVKL